MKCEKCGHELTYLAIDLFDHSGSNHTVKVPFKEYDYNKTIELETNSDWIGYGLDENEMLNTIWCPYCHEYPFENTKIKTMEIVRLALFKGFKNTDIDANKYQVALNHVNECSDGNHPPYTVADVNDEDVQNLQELVDRAIKKKPFMIADKGFEADESSHLCCPGCKMPIINVWSKRDYKPRYCHNCGQKLNWND